MHCEAKKLHHFIFAITLSELSILQWLLVYMYPNKYETKWHQNYAGLWNAAYVHVLWPTSVLLRKLKSRHYRLKIFKWNIT